MKNKITILIIASVAALIALSAIQAYLIDNTYELKKEAFIRETNNAISDIDNLSVLDSLVDVVSENLKDHISDYQNKRITKAEVLSRLKIIADSVNPQYNAIYKKELEKIDLGYKIKYKKQIKSIVIFKGNSIDTIFPNTKQTDTSFRLFGEDFDNQQTHTIKNARTFGEFQYTNHENDSVYTDSFDLEVKTNDIMFISDSKSIVFRRLGSLLIISVLLFLFVIGLLYYSIKNLINQKKITEVKTDFINNITHELKTPLATLSVASKSLKTKGIKDSPKAFDNALNIVDRQNTRLQKLIDQVLTNSLSSEEIVLAKDAVIDNEYFHNLIEDFKLSTQQRELQIINKVFEEEVLLRIDTFHFTTAILNILENAVKYGKDRTEIHLETTIKNNEYNIRISDNGIGISEKDQTQIFEKFYRVSHGNVHNVKGLGLGLYYTAQIVNAHQGKITVTSELKKGTTFTITIPIN